MIFRSALIPIPSLGADIRERQLAGNRTATGHSTNETV
jgi:hypothetical protein